MPFRDTFGHSRTLLLLSRAIAAGSLPPSLLFVGPPGIGKRRVALGVAQALNCTTPLRDVALHGSEGAAPTVLPVDACGECPSCLRIARGVHSDVIQLAPTEDRATVSMDQVRDLNERVGYLPFEARRRAVIIDEPGEVLLGPTQNALLKTLEEPPSGTVFMLVSSQPEALLPTVRSRCAAVRFAPLEPAEVARCLVEAHGVEAVAARARAAVADGSVGAALAASELEAVRDSGRRLLVRLARTRDARARLDATREIAGKGGKGSGLGERDALAAHLRVLHGLLRDLGVLSTSADDRSLAHADLRSALLDLVPAFDRQRLIGAFTAIDRALAALERNASPKIVADWLVLQI